MKKVLYTTTALVAFTGAAAADITLSGRAEMGIFGGDEITTGGATTEDIIDQFFTDIDVTFTMSGETDNGLTFGAAIDIDEGGSGAAAVADNSDDGGIAIFLSGNFGTITMGDTDGALDWALTEAAVGNAGSLADDETAHGGYLGAYADGAYDGQILRYDYSIGDFGFAVSVEQDDNGTATGIDADTGYAFGFRYSFSFSGGEVDFGLGYQFAEFDDDFTPGELNEDVLGGPIAINGDSVDVIGLSVAASLDNGLSAGIQYSEWEYSFGDTDTHLGVGAGYTFDAFTVSFNYGMWDLDSRGAEVSGFGLAAAYDLGGGAVVHAGYGVSDYGDFDADLDAVSTYSLGVAFSF